MKVEKRTCLKEYPYQDSKGNIYSLEIGKKYDTHLQEDGRIFVFTKCWFPVDAEYFGEPHDN